jgi:hypothetical protein
MDQNQVIDQLIAEVTALRIRVTQLEVEQTATASVARAAATEDTTPPSGAGTTTLVKGDRIRIRNTVRKRPNSQR